jgi:hypothetical protein
MTPVPEGIITTSETMGNLDPQEEPATPYSAVNLALWNRWQEALPESPGYMATQLLADLEADGWRLVR